MTLSRYDEWTGTFGTDEQPGRQLRPLRVPQPDHRLPAGLLAPGHRHLAVRQRRARRAAHDDRGHGRRAGRRRRGPAHGGPLLQPADGPDRSRRAVHRSGAPLRGLARLGLPVHALPGLLRRDDGHHAPSSPTSTWCRASRPLGGTVPRTCIARGRTRHGAVLVRRSAGRGHPGRDRLGHARAPPAAAGPPSRRRPLSLPVLRGRPGHHRGAALAAGRHGLLHRHQRRPHHRQERPAPLEPDRVGAHVGVDLGPLRHHHGPRGLRARAPRRGELGPAQRRRRATGRAPSTPTATARATCSGTAPGSASDCRVARARAAARSRRPRSPSAAPTTTCSPATSTATATTTCSGTARSSGAAYLWRSDGDGTFTTSRLAPGAGRRPLLLDTQRRRRRRGLLVRPGLAVRLALELDRQQPSPSRPARCPGTLPAPRGRLRRQRPRRHLLVRPGRGGRLPVAPRQPTAAP